MPASDVAVAQSLIFSTRMGRERSACRLLMLTGRVCIVALATALTLGLTPDVVSAQATTNGITIPAAHPRIWWTADRIARARTWYQSNPFTPRPDDPMANATRCVLTGEATYCQVAVNYAMNQLCSNAACNSTDPNYGVAADDARWEGENVITVFDWCYAYFTPTQRATLISRWNTYFANIRLRSWGGPTMYHSNYNWGYMRNEILWGIATWGENTEAGTNLQYGLQTRWTNTLAPYFTGPGRGGLFQEGSAYGSAIGEYSTVPFGTAALLGRDLYRETNFFREAVIYMAHATLPAPTYNRNNGGSDWEIFPFADDERFFDGGMPARGNYGTFMVAMADYFRDSAIGGIARRWVNMVNPTRPVHLRAIDRGGAEQPFASLPLDYVTIGGRFAYGRNDWSAGATVFNLQLDHTDDDGHKHNDAGSWQLWRAGRWLSRETTGYAQDIVGYGGAAVDANNAAAHNTLLVGGRGPAAGYIQGPSNVFRLESQPSHFFAAVDLTPAYRATHPVLDNPAVAHLEREFVFVRSLETLVVFDRIETTTAAPVKTFLARFETNPTVDVAGRVVTAVNGPQAVCITTLVPAAPTYRPIVNEGGSIGQFRLEVETSGATQSYFLNVVQAKGATDANVLASVTENSSTYVLTLTHPSRGSVVIALQKGRVSTGGTITVGGQLLALTSSVGSAVVSESGVSWSGVTVPPVIGPAPPTGVRIVR